MADHSSDQSDRTPATVTAVVQESKTIRRLQLRVTDNNVTFKAGQWVDFFIPGVSPFTGYSMCSSPQHLKDDGVLELAIKYSDYPPTEWVHAQCKMGDQVQIKVSGTFFYDPAPEEDPQDLLLLAAGIGINPIYSIYQYYLDLDKRQPQGRLAFLYSARNWDELVFKETILKTAAENNKIQAKLFSTSQSTDEGYPVTNKRIGGEDIRNAVANLNKVKTRVYICGPPAFIDDMEQFCLDLGLQHNQILYEKWW